MSSSMEFWGVEVKAGQPLKVTPEDDVILHLSHAALGEAKKTKENEFVPLFIKVGDKKLVLGTLSPETIPQLAFDLVLEQEFELSHNWKNGSIYFTGYKSILPDVASNSPETGKVQKAKPAAPAKAAAAKPEAAKPKSKAAAVPVKPENESDESDDDEDDSDDDSDESGEDAGADSDEDDDSDDSEDEKTPTPKKPEQGKKRSNDSAVKTPVPAKKAKQATPAKTDGKKAAAHTATPHPAKNAAKTAGSAAKSPKSGGEFACKSCDRSFGSDGALQSHAKAKHTAK
ncbi:unnamed protein product [Linum tenue]|uniref:C2H2-type domain-containing protein n=1 Tax=Linum tenue TaxID=586396 RepID=A0AAV0QKH1_9ROSI|nr:unnamed protein product [Linum tenue]